MFAPISQRIFRDPVFEVADEYECWMAASAQNGFSASAVEICKRDKPEEIYADKALSKDDESTTHRANLRGLVICCERVAPGSTVRIHTNYDAAIKTIEGARTWEDNDMINTSGRAAQDDLVADFNEIVRARNLTLEGVLHPERKGGADFDRIKRLKKIAVALVKGRKA